MPDEEVVTDSGNAATVVRDPSAVLEKNRELLEKNRVANDRLNALHQALGGRDAATVMHIVADAEKAEEERQKKLGELDGIIEKRVKARDDHWAPQVAQKESELSELRAEKFENSVKSAALKAGIAVDDLDLAVAFVKDKKFVKLDETGKKLMVVDSDGDATGATLDEFFGTALKKIAPKLYPSTIGSGGGATPGSGGSRGHSGIVDKTDAAAFLANMDKIATGELKVA